MMLLLIAALVVVEKENRKRGMKRWKAAKRKMLNGEKAVKEFFRKEENFSFMGINERKKGIPARMLSPLLVKGKQKLLP